MQGLIIVSDGDTYVAFSLCASNLYVSWHSSVQIIGKYQLTGFHRSLTGRPCDDIPYSYILDFDHHPFCMD